MKKPFITILIFYLFFHFVIPEIYYLFFADSHIYSDLIDPIASNKAFWLNAVSIFGVICLIYAFPFNNDKTYPVIKSPAATELFYISVVYGLIYLFASGGFSGLLSGKLSGSLYNYTNLFLNPMVLLMCAVFLQVKQVNVFMMVLLYILLATISGSRSGIISILLLFFIGLGFYNFYLYKKNLKKILYFFLILSPFLFIFATYLRYGASNMDWKTIIDKIVGRISLIESGMIPIHFKDANSNHLSLFYDKYGIINQLKIIIDSTIPGDIFSKDVMPNQYYREIFLGQSHSFVIENYMSINMSLPVYFYLIFGYWGLPITILFLFFYFMILYTNRSNAYLTILLLSIIYPILIYFDWAMVFNQFFVTLLTMLTLLGYKVFRNSLRTKNNHLKINAD